MKLSNLERLLEICNEFSENHEKYGFCEFDIQIKISLDRSYSIELEFPVIGAVPIYIIPDSSLSVTQWYDCPNNWMDKKGKQIIINWIIENGEVFGLNRGCDETCHYKSISIFP